MKSSKMLQYKGYYGSVDIDPDNNLLFGKVEFVRALITYEATDAASLVSAFHESVDCYLDLCEKQCIEPEQPFKGSLNVRIGRERHRKAWLAARLLDKSLNEYLCQALDDSFENMPTPGKRHIKVSKRSSKKSPDERKSA